MGRPSELTAVRQARACELIKLGLPLSRVAEGMGVSYATFRGWRQKGGEGLEPYASFLAATKAAEVEMEEICLGNIAAAALDPKNWAANAWRLERRWPDRYAAGYYRVRAKAAKQGEMDATKTAPPAPDVAAIVRYLAETRPELLRDALAAVSGEETRQ